MKSISKFLSKIEVYLSFQPMDSFGASLFRIIFASFCLISLVGVFRIDTLSNYPDFLFNPPISIASFFDKLPNIYILHTLNILNIFFLVGMLVGFKTKWSSILFSCVFYLSTSFIYAFSKIGHQHFIFFTPLIFAFSNWGEKYSLDSTLSFKKTKTYNTYPLFVLIIAFSFFTAGFSKLLGGWLDINFQAVRFYVIRDYTFVNRQNVLTEIAVNKVTSKFFWELMDYLIVLIEVIPLFFMLNRKMFRRLMFILATFHVGVYAVMNIPFSIYPLIYTPFIIDWKNSKLLAKLNRIMQSFSVKKIPLLIIIFLMLIISSTLHYLLNFNDLMGLSVHRGIILILSYIACCIFFVESEFSKKAN